MITKAKAHENIPLNIHFTTCFMILECKVVTEIAQKAVLDTVSVLLLLLL